MRILIVANSISGGGAERSMRIINKELRSHGHESILLCINNSGSDIADEGEVILRREWNSGFVGTASSFFDFFKQLRKLAPETIIVNCELPELFSALAPFSVEKFIVVEHTSNPWAGRKRLGFLVRVILNLRKPTWVTVNKKQKGIWPLNRESIFIPNPVESPKLSSNLSPSAPFVFIGRLRKEKGIRMILDAISAERQEIDVFGSGELEDELRGRFLNGVHFKGFVENPWQYVNQNQTLIVASEYEGDGIVIVEGILGGLPILLLDNVDLRRFKLSDSSYFENVEELRRKIGGISSDRDLYRPDAGVKEIYKSERNLNSVMANWSELLS